MKSVTFSGERLKNARLIRALTLTELANRTGISKQSLSVYENTINGHVDYKKVQALARILGFPVEFFFQQDRLKALTEVTYFRSMASATKMNQAAQGKKLDYVAKMYEVLFQYVDFPTLNLPQIEFSGTDDEFDTEANENMKFQIERIASAVRESWGIGNVPISNLQLLLEKNGIIVTGFNTFEDKIDAFSQRTVVDGSDVFLIAVALGQRPEGRIFFDMAHELGHILLHPWSESLDLITKEEFKSREKQANMFASAFLLPDAGFGNELRQYVAYATDLKFYQALKKKWKASIQAMLYRSADLGVITTNQYQYLMRQVSKNGWRTKEPGDEPYALNETIFQGAIDLLIEENILDPEGVLRVFNNNSLSIYPIDIEEWLNLRKDTLRSKNKEAKIIQLRKSGD